jgi:hypothetical protein
MDEAAAETGAEVASSAVPLPLHILDTASGDRDGSGRISTHSLRMSRPNFQLNEDHETLLAVSRPEEAAPDQHVQRRVGYVKSALLIDQIEAHGIIGPKDGAKPRKVL